MRVLVTGVSGGIGSAIAGKFLESGHEVVGFDIKEPCEAFCSSKTKKLFTFYKVDVSDATQLPELSGINILINCAGVPCERTAIQVNLVGYINVGEKYAFCDSITSVLNINSVATHTGMELPHYCASMGGRHAYTKNLTLRLGKRGVTVNSISPGGIITDWNKEIIENPSLYAQVKSETLLNKWAEPIEVAELAYFLTVVNKSIIGQDIVLDNGEMARYNWITAE